MTTPGFPAVCAGCIGGGRILCGWPGKTERGSVAYIEKTLPGHAKGMVRERSVQTESVIEPEKMEIFSEKIVSHITMRNIL